MTKIWNLVNHKGEDDYTQDVNVIKQTGKLPDSLRLKR